MEKSGRITDEGKQEKLGKGSSFVDADFYEESNEKNNSTKDNEENNAANQQSEEPVKPFSSDKVLIITILVIVILLATFFASKYFFKLNAPKTIDDLHKLNIEGGIKSDNAYMYNGFSFVFNEGLWYTQAKIGSSTYGVALHYGPKELEDIKIEGTLDNRFFNTSSFYVTFNPLGKELQYTALAVSELDSSMIQVFGFTPIAACDKNETEDCHIVPIITCNNTDEPVVYMMDSETPRVVLDGNCIKIQGRSKDLVRATNRLLYFFYRIMGR